MAIPAALMDQSLEERIMGRVIMLENRVKYLEEWNNYFIVRNKAIEAEINDLKMKGAVIRG